MPERAPRILKLRLPTPYPVGDINAYLIDGPEPTLIDTGVFSSRSRDALKQRLEEQGVRLEDIRRIFITHDHYDHAGSALYLSHACQAELVIHERSTVFSKWTETSQERLFQFMLKCNVPREPLEQAFKMFGSGERFADTESTPFSVVRIKGGETLACNGLSLTALHTPGHSPDHLCFVDEAGGRLFCGDLLLPHITPNPLLHLDPTDGYRRSHSLLDYMDSLAKLEKFDLTTGYSGHGPEIPDVPALITKNKGFIRDRARLFDEKIGAGADNPFDLSRSAFGDLDLANSYLAVSETVAYLDLLEREGKISVDWEGDTIRFERSR